MQLKKEILEECINNRIYLGISEKEMASYLDGVSEKEYCLFEAGTYIMSIKNLESIKRLLCISRKNKIRLEKYIDINGLDDEQARDIYEVVYSIVGDINA